MKITNKERKRWIDNNKDFNEWWKMTGLPKLDFIKQYKEDIDCIIIDAINKKQQIIRPLLIKQPGDLRIGQ